MTKLRAGFATTVLAAFLMIDAHGLSAKEPASPRAASYQNWKHSGSMWLLTTPEGADLPAAASVEGFPLLVRLDKDWFDFAQARANGEDLRVSTSTGDPLACQIEESNAKHGTASIWVRIPSIKGNARQEIKLHWGQADATSESDGKAVFNESNGYLSVWHMNDPVRDEVGTLPSTDTGTTATAGVIGAARHLADGKGIFGGDKIPNYPTGASSHSTETWVRPERPNTTLIAWGNEQAQGKVVMQFRSPPHIRMDCYFSGGDVGSDSRLPLGDWYNNYDFVGDLDEVRISRVARSADWIKLQFENQKLHQTLVGPLVQPGNEFSVSPLQLVVGEGQSAKVSANAGGAQQVLWILKRDGQESIVATDRFSHAFDAGRVPKSLIAPRSNASDRGAISDNPLTATLTVNAIYAGEVRTKDIAITISDDIPEPVFTLAAPAKWDGRETIEVVPQISNLAEMQAKGAGQLNFHWAVDDVAVIKQVVPGKLNLKRAQGNGVMRVSATIDNGGAKGVQSITIAVTEPPPSKDLWVSRPLADTEQPEDNQFIARDGPVASCGVAIPIAAGRSEVSNRLLLNVSNGAARCLSRLTASRSNRMDSKSRSPSLWIRPPAAQRTRMQSPRLLTPVTAATAGRKSNSTSPV